MNEHELDQELKKGAAELPDISPALKNSLSEFVLDNKTRTRRDHSGASFALYASAAIIVLSMGLWAATFGFSAETSPAESSKIDYEKLFAETSMPEVKFPKVKIPSINPLVSGDLIASFLRDNGSNPYKKELESFALLSKRIAANFSDELMLDSFIKRTE